MRVPAPHAVAASLMLALVLAGTGCGSAAHVQAASSSAAAGPGADRAGLRSLDGGQGAAGAGTGRGDSNPAAPATLITAAVVASAPVPSSRPGPPTLAPKSVADGDSAPTTMPAGPATAPPGASPATGPTTTSAAPGTSAASSTAPAPGPRATAEATTASTAAPTTTSTAPVLITGGTAEVADLALGEEHSLSVLNLLRQSLAAPVLVRDPAMDAYAREWSRHMAETGDFNHSPGPYGENIAFSRNLALTASEAAELFETLWTASTDHYANMTQPRYTKVGVGLYRTGRGWYGTHVFAY